MIEDLGLHDATLIAVHMTWADGTCVMTIRHSQLSDCTLTFSCVSNLVMPRTSPWGPSQSISSACQRIKDQYEIEMQSGDVFRIEATDVKLTPLIMVGKTGFCAYGSTVQSRTELTRLLKQRNAQFVEVRLEPGAGYEQVSEAMTAIQEAGGKIGIVGNIRNE